MRTLTLTLIALLMLSSLSGYADCGKCSKTTEDTLKFSEATTLVWVMNPVAQTKLRKVFTQKQLATPVFKLAFRIETPAQLNFPAPVLGPSELDTLELASLKQVPAFAFPELNLGTVEDLNLAGIEELKSVSPLAFPQPELLSLDGLDLQELEKLKQVPAEGTSLARKK